MMPSVPVMGPVNTNSFVVDSRGHIPAIGFGQAANALKDIIEMSAKHYFVPATRLTKDQKFRNLTATWKLETRYDSSAASIASHPAYQQIIGMGPSALPLIFEQLRNDPQHWFMALTAITGINPIKKEHRGNIGAMTQDWLDWGRNNGFNN